MTARLPIEDVVDDIRQSLRVADSLILEAPPGAGKTTMVPLALMSESWLGYQKIIVVEPRRVAARTAAQRMAMLLDEVPGQTIGYRMRLETKVSHYTKIEVVTEGVLARMLQQDPSLEGVGLVIFDEFHERHLDADLGLAACLKLRQIFRQDEPLKLLVMSATLGELDLEVYLSAPRISSEGRLHDVEIVYGNASQPRERIADRVVTTVQQALLENPDSSMLVFLPGQGEIRDVERQLADRIEQPDLRIVPLYGNLTLTEQQQAIEPLAVGRKIVLATNIAETSLTIEGVDVVVDAGLVRVPVFDPGTGMSRLQVRKISRASSVQRAGRAGRLRAGKCYRLWSKQQQDQLSASIAPEIEGADLSPMVLQLAAWGFSDFSELEWLNLPPAGAWQQAVDLLVQLGALADSSPLLMTEHGERIAQLGVHPRLGHMLVCGAQAGLSQQASFLAAVFSDRDPFSRDNPDVSFRLSLLQGTTRVPHSSSGWVNRTRRLAAQYERSIDAIECLRRVPEKQSIGFLVACAYPDRLCRKRHGGAYQMSNGRSVSFRAHHALEKEQWLAVSEVNGAHRSKGDVIGSATSFDPALFEDHFEHLLTDLTRCEWDIKAKRFVAERQLKVGALLLSSEKVEQVSADQRVEAIINYLEHRGFSQLGWNKETDQLQARIELLRQFYPDMPDSSSSYLRSEMRTWLAPYLMGVSTLDQIKRIDLLEIIRSRLSYEQLQLLNQQVPERFQVASGNRFRIDYTQSPPVLSVKLQEMIGINQTPTVAGGEVSLLIHLLSPAGRPLQVTQDLAGFWRSSYAEIRKEMKGRYPKHDWPEIKPE